MDYLNKYNLYTVMIVNNFTDGSHNLFGKHNSAKYTYDLTDMDVEVMNKDQLLNYIKDYAYNEHLQTIYVVKEDKYLAIEFELYYSETKDCTCTMLKIEGIEETE